MRTEAPSESPAAEYNRALLSGDPKEALQHLLLAAAAGCVRAQFRLGLAYQTGVAVPVDFRGAAAWYERAAAGADRHAMANLGRIWLSGQGVEMNELEAYTWIRSAVGLGNQALIPLLAVLEARIQGGVTPIQAAALVPESPPGRPCKLVRCDPSRCQAV